MGEVSEFEYLGFVLDELGTNAAECCGKVAIWRTAADAISSLVNAGSLFDCAWVLHDVIRVSVVNT